MCLIRKLQNKTSDTSSNVHTHSILSDGDFSFEEIYKKSETLANMFHKKILLSVTDHDILNKESFLKFKDKNPKIDLIAGVEVSTRTNFVIKDTELHFLVYSEDGNLDYLKDTIDDNLKKRKEYAIELIAYANQKLDGKLDYKDLDKYLGSKTKYLSKRKLGLYLIEKFGLSMKELDNYFLKSKLNFISSVELIKEVKKNNGIIIWAHPIKSLKSEETSNILKVLNTFYTLGLDGVERNPRKSDKYILKNHNLNDIYLENRARFKLETFAYDQHSQKDWSSYTTYLENEFIKQGRIVAI